ncbi:hypothetical protein PAMP_004766 [Pampus punctatissimus]
MYATRKIKEEMASLQQQPKAEPKTLSRELSFPRTTSLHKTLSIQNVTQNETPWENFTLNRCLFVAITILVLTSETLRGQRTAEEEEEVGLTVRGSGTLRHRRQPPEPETTLWEVMFWWLPDLDDEEDEDEDNEGDVKKGKSRIGATARASRGLRNKPLADKKLMKQGEGKLKDRRAKKAKDKETRQDKKQKDKQDRPEEEVHEEDEGDENETAEPKQNKKLEEKKEKKKTQKG